MEKTVDDRMSQISNSLEDFPNTFKENTAFFMMGILVLKEASKNPEDKFKAKFLAKQVRKQAEELIKNIDIMIFDEKKEEKKDDKPNGDGNGPKAS